MTETVGPLDSAALPAAAPSPAAAPAPREGEPGAARRAGRVRDYVALTKPRIIELLLVTTVPPMFLAAGGWPGGWRIAATMLGGMLTAGSANALNMVRDRDIDAVMARTRHRPLPDGRISAGAATCFAVGLGASGTVWLWWSVGWLASMLAAGALVFYVAVYSWWLKRTTVHNIVIGGAAGAVPALIGWAAVTGELAAGAWVLFAIVVAWTPPHFWALAVICDRDYAAAQVPMLPVVHGRAEAARRSLRYAGATVALSLALPIVTEVGVVYILVAVLTGADFLRRALRMWRDPVPPTARRLFTGSIAYLAVLFTAVAIDVVLPW